MYRYTMDTLPDADRALLYNAMYHASETAADGFDQYFGIPDGLPGTKSRGHDSCAHHETECRPADLHSPATLARASSSDSVSASGRVGRKKVTRSMPAST